MQENPFSPRQSYPRIKAIMLAGGTLAAIAVFLFTYLKWRSLPIALAITVAITLFIFVLLRNILKEGQTRRGRYRRSQHK